MLCVELTCELNLTSICGRGNDFNIHYHPSKHGQSEGDPGGLTSSPSASSQVAS